MALFLVAISSPSACAQPAAQRSQVAPGQIIILTDSGADAEAVARAVGTIPGARLAGPLGSGEMGFWLVRAPQGAEAATTRALMRHPLIRLAEPDRIISLNPPPQD